METINFTGKVIIEFYGNGCINCQLMAPILDSIERDMTDIKFYRINADIYPDLVQKFQVTSLPTLLLFKNNRKITTIVGMKSQSTLQMLIFNAMN